MCLVSKIEDWRFSKLPLEKKRILIDAVIESITPYRPLNLDENAPQPRIIARCLYYALHNHPKSEKDSQTDSNKFRY